MTEAPHTESGLWRALERHDPAVWVLRWLRQNFSLPSVLTILGIIGAGGGYIVNLKTRVVVLETRVVPVLLADKQEHENGVRITALEERIGRIEHNWDEAVAHASEPPIPHATPRQAQPNLAMRRPNTPRRTAP